jgi:hypothetical protein
LRALLSLETDNATLHYQPQFTRRQSNLRVPALQARGARYHRDFPPRDSTRNSRIPSETLAKNSGNRK